jgi:phenylacetate-CoA ligase
MGILNTIYNYLPTSLQNLAVSVYGYKWQKRRFGGIFESELKRCKQRESFTKEEWEKYQTENLRKLLVHAFETVPFYNSIFKEHEFTKDQLEKLELNELSKLPLLTKEDLRKFGTSTLLSSQKEKSGEFYSSSGSTGTPTQILFSAAMHQRWSAVFEARIRNWAGLTIKDARGMIGGRRIVKDAENKGPFHRYNFIEKQVYFSAYHISSSNAKMYSDAMLKHHIKYMTGYAMSNYFLARFIEEQKTKAPKLKAVITSSEKLTDEMRATFERVYQCKSFDSYSGLEACGLITECEHHKLHISPDVGIIELIKDNGTYAEPGEVGEAICTGLLNYDQPLIRYRIGDLIKLSKDQQCKCGRQMPIVDEIIGRVEDTVIGKDGREMVRFHGIFINIPNIIEGQIIQHTLNDFEINIVCSETLTAKEKSELTQRMESQLGSIKLTITETNNIPRNQNGKFKAVISHVKRNI